MIFNDIKIVYIVGTSHSLQCGKQDEKRTKTFKQEMCRLHGKHKIKRIVEEMSPGGLKHHKVEKTVCQQTFENVCIQHVDLDDDDRKKWFLDDDTIINMESIRIGHCKDSTLLRPSFNNLVHEIRERVFVARIISGQEWPVLFVCGANHAVPVSKLLHQLSVRAKILHRDFEC